VSQWRISIMGDRPGHLQQSGYNSRTKRRTTKWKPVLHPNARIHWTERAKCMHKDKNTVYAASRAAGAPPRPVKPYEKARVDIAMLVTTHTRRDRDNLMSSVKGVMDGLVMAGILVDDNIEVVDGPHVSVTVGECYGYEVIVTPLEVG